MAEMKWEHCKFHIWEIFAAQGDNCMSIVQMREVLKKRTKYKNSYKWINKVNAMSDNQVKAVYFRMLRAGELE